MPVVPAAVALPYRANRPSGAGPAASAAGHRGRAIERIRTQLPASRTAITAHDLRALPVGEADSRAIVPAPDTQGYEDRRLEGRGGLRDRICYDPETR